MSFTSYIFYRPLHIALFAQLTLTMSDDVNAKNVIPSLELQGHRGARGLAPENSLLAFNLAYLHGMTTIELDSTLTADGHLVIYHDTLTNAELCRSSTGASLPRRPILKMTLREVQALDCGSLSHPRFPKQIREVVHPPTLVDVISLESAWGSRVLYNLEIKTDSTHSVQHKHQAIEALRREVGKVALKYPSIWSRLTLQSFDFDILRLAKLALPRLRRSVLLEPEVDRSVQPPHVIRSVDGKEVEEALKLDVQVISPYHEVLTESMIEGAHRRGLKVIPWTVNDSNRMRQLIVLGVDGIISDYPDRLAKVVEELGPSVECRTRHSDPACTSSIPMLSGRSNRTKRANQSVE